MNSLSENSSETEGSGVFRYRVAVLVLLCVCAIGITGCGFELRGSSAKIRIESLYLEFLSGDSELDRQLRRRLLEEGVQVTNARGNAVWVLTLDNGKESRRIASTNSRITVARYELSHQIDMQLESNQQPVPQPETLIVTRSYDYDSSNLVGSDNEEELLRREMRSDLVAQIINRLAYLSANSP